MKCPDCGAPMSGGVCKQCGYKAKGKGGGSAPSFGKKSAAPNMFTKTVMPPVKPGKGMPFGRKAGRR